MTTLLTKAFEIASALPDSIQDALAQELMEEIEWEKQWDKTLDSSSSKLNILAEKAFNEYKNGNTEEMGIDEL